MQTCRLAFSKSGTGGIDEKGHFFGRGRQFVQNLKLLRPHFCCKVVVPVTLPPGRLRLVTSPSVTGSAPTAKTIGIVVVAALAANAAGVLPRTASRSPYGGP